jgi:cytochrome c oxidase subunit IV
METLLESAATRAHYIAIWRWLVVLVLAALLVTLLPIPKIAALVLVFGIALTKAVMVMRDYMHLKAETLIIHAIALIPILLFIGLALTLIPDIALRH